MSNHISDNSMMKMYTVISRMVENMPIRFISRISEHDKKHLGFYVPKHVTNFYSLKPGRYKGGISLEFGDVTSCQISLTKFKHTLRGRLPPNVGKKGAISEVWIYRDTWIAPKEK